MRAKIIISIVGVGCLVLSIVGSFFYGLRLGTQNGTWRADTETAYTLAYALKLRDTGESQKAAAALHTLLYAAAYNSDKYKDSLLLNEANRKAGERCLQAVADYYWKHPTSFDLNWEGTNVPATDPVLQQRMQPFIGLFGERHRRIAEILISRKKNQNATMNASQPIRPATNQSSSTNGTNR